jgi:quinoprotein dehydrogenase-associated probable ABC transporter substrate-binding protein
MRQFWHLSGIAAAMLVAASAAAQTSDLVPRTELRVCADPNNLPFSNEKGEGFENKIAALIGQDLNLPVSNVWFPQVIGFVRNTLGAHRCDLVLGAVAGDELVETTNPYYYTTYVMAYRADRNLNLTAIDHDTMQTFTIGVVAGTPPSDLLIRHGLMGRVHAYPLMVDTRYDAPMHDMLQDVAHGKIDVALIWGPPAGYYVHQEKLPLILVPLQNEPGAPRMDYHIAMGVRHNEPEWRRKINAAILREHDGIAEVLKSYGVPLLDEQGKLMK